MSSTKSNENGSGVNELGAFMVAGLALLAVVKLWDRKLAPWLAHYLTVTDGAVSVHAGHLTATRVPSSGSLSRSSSWPWPSPPQSVG